MDLLTEGGMLLAGRYQASREVSWCGESVIYLGTDLETGERVTIHEFWPPSILKKDAETGELTVREGCGVKYKSLSSDYEELCQYIRHLKDSLCVMPVMDVFWQNNTVYCVFTYFDCETLDDFLAKSGQPVPWPKLKKMIAPIVKTLSRMHADGVYHRGLSPETLLLDAKGKIWLSGFCIPAARTADSEIDSTLYFGYSAPEQYSSSSWQGSWSDVYSLAAVLYRALTGITPVEWRQRRQGKGIIAPNTLDPSIPENVSNAILTALSIDIRSRYRAIEEFWCALLVGPGEGTAIYSGPLLPAQEPAPKRNLARSLLLVVGTLLAVVTISVLAAELVLSRLIPEPEPASPAEASSSEEEHASAPVPVIVTPKLIGDNVEEVLQNPLYSSLFTFEIMKEYDERHPAGEILAQEPSPGEEPSEDGKITILISKGSEMVLMPDVIGMDVEAAKRILEGQGISYKVEEVIDVTEPSNTVVKTSILADGTVYRTKDTVILTVATYL